MIRGKIDILVVDDDVSHCTILQALLRGWGYNVALAYSGHDALAQVREKVFDLVLCDVRMAEMDGIATLKEIKALNPAIPILIMTAFSSVETAVEALKAGALDYLIKPLDFDRLQETLEKALAHTRETGAELPSASAAQFGMIGSSPAMQHLLNEIAMVAPSDATVLIHGDSGTGKELVARGGRARGGPAYTPVAPGAINRWSRSTARRLMNRCWSPSCLVTKKVRLPVRINVGRDALSKLTAGHCFLMKSAISRR